MKVIIIDDEKQGILTLRKMIDLYCPEVMIVAECSNAKEGMAALESFKPDLVFLDIAMPGMSGIEMLKEIKDIDFDFIFVTAHDQFMLQAIKLSAVDYLLKPVHEDELIEAILKFQKKSSKLSSGQKMEALAHNIKEPTSQYSKVCIPTFEGFIIKKIEDIIYCEADNTYTKIFLVDNTTLLVTRPLITYETLLSDCNFVRIHKSYLINMHHLQNYRKADGGSVLLTNNIKLEVSKRKKDVLTDAMKKVFRV